MMNDVVNNREEPLLGDVRAEMRAIQIVMETLLSTMISHNPAVVSTFLDLKAARLRNLSLMPISSEEDVFRNRLIAEKTEKMFVALDAVLLKVRGER